MFSMTHFQHLINFHSFHLFSFYSVSLNCFLHSSFFFLTAFVNLPFHQGVSLYLSLVVVHLHTASAFTSVSLNSFHSSSTVLISLFGILPFFLFFNSSQISLFYFKYLNLWCPCYCLNYFFLFLKSATICGHCQNSH